MFEGTIDENLERDMLEFVDRIPLLLAELSVLPTTRAHGDACPQNLLRTGEGAVALDWGSFGTVTAGFDLGQLLGRGLAISMAFQSGLPALFPRELDGPVTDEVRGLVHARAGMARFLVDELTASES